ncbi:hypothetical protein FRC20_008896 [Serendipita sp. 405]|nr:hypothetical protein FRC20_008896 [Serendipita sp. 405]
MSEEEAATPVINKNKRHRKEKPWDTDDIDHGKWMLSLTTTIRPVLLQKSPHLQLCFPNTEKSTSERYGEPLHAL